MKDFQTTLKIEDLKFDPIIDDEFEVSICDIQLNEVNDYFDAYNSSGDLERFDDIYYEVESFTVYYNGQDITGLLTFKAQNDIVDQIIRRIK